MKYDVFISHSSKDAVMARSICKYLENNGLSCWIAPRNVKVGKLYSSEIIDGIKASQVFLLVFSSSSNKSKHVISELDVAFNSEKVIIPFFIDEGMLSDSFSYYLAATHRIIAHPKPSEKFEDLKETIINNIPKLAAAREHDQMWDSVAAEMGLTVEALKAMSLSSKEKPKKGNKSRYDILRNDEGEIMIIIEAINRRDDSPLLIMDEKANYALLYRSRESTIVFSDITEEAAKAIRKVVSVNICEIVKDDVVDEYTAPVRIVKDVRALMD